MPKMQLQILLANKNIPMNPELHYLDHLQNNSISKNCSRFGKSTRFKKSSALQTQFLYHPRNPMHSRSCNFGFGERSKLGASVKAIAPSPNKYNLRKFPHAGSVAHRMGLSRDQATFGSIKVEIKTKASNPAPCSYKIKGTLRNTKFTIKERFRTEESYRRSPGPGEYDLVCLNEKGAYPVSQYKNTRTIIMDACKNIPEKMKQGPGPAAYDLANTSSSQRLKDLNESKSTSFGTSLRKGPEQNSKWVPGPGQYDFFSPFKKVGSIQRIKTDH